MSEVKCIITEKQEIDPTVPSWAKTATKPTYNASEVGAVPTTRKVNNKALSADITLNASDVGAAPTSHGTHVSYSTTTPKAPGTATVGTETSLSRGDHVHPAQTSITGNAGTATKLQTARTIQVNLASNSASSFNGSANITPGVTGILPQANGGTGATSIEALR